MRLLPYLVCAALALGVSWSAVAQPAASPPEAAAAGALRMGPGDAVRITVYQSPDLSIEARLTDTGVISYPLLGRVALAGLTVTEGEARIAEQLRKGDFVKNPQVSIVVTQVRANQVNVLGYVARPGRVPLDIAGMRLSEILALSGGVTDEGAETVIVSGQRDGRPFSRTIDLSRIFTPEGRVDDIVMQPGDSVWVDRMPVVYLYGEVQRPGQVRMARGMSVMQALASAGGLTQRGTQRGLQLHRRGATGAVQTSTPAMNDTLRDGDVLYVQESLF